MVFVCLWVNTITLLLQFHLLSSGRLPVTAILCFVYFSAGSCMTSLSLKWQNLLSGQLVFYFFCSVPVLHLRSVNALKGSSGPGIRSVRYKGGLVMCFFLMVDLLLELEVASDGRIFINWFFLFELKYRLAWFSCVFWFWCFCGVLVVAKLPYDACQETFSFNFLLLNFFLQLFCFIVFLL